jgi:ABC-type lipoprotein release transport system permease subunit
MNLKLVEYALGSLLRHKGRNIFVFIVFTLLTTLTFSLFSISGAIKKETGYSAANLPDITVQKITGGRQQYISTALAEEIALIPGVTSVTPRVWGYYRFEYLNTNLTIVGVDIFDPFKSETIDKLTKHLDLQKLSDGGYMFIGGSLDRLIKSIYGKNEFSFQKPDGEYITLKTAGVFPDFSAMISADIVLTDMKTAGAILGIDKNFAADIAVNIANDQEISTAAEKITNLSPSYQTVTKEVILASYQNMADFKGGLFLLFFITALTAFFVIVFDRASGLSAGEKKETAVLKAVGWSTSDVIKVKMYEAFILSGTAYALSALLSIAYVYILNAPGLAHIFMGYSYMRPQFQIPFHFDIQTAVTVFFIIFPVYGAAVIIPAWRAASADPGEIVR